MQLSHRHIEVFRALMMAGSVTGAARLLFTSQPTISRELARIEQVLGFVLFDRERTQLRPTTAALLLFDEVKRAYAGLEKVASVADSLRTYTDGQLSLITLPAFAHCLLPGACVRFREHFPAVAISLAAQESPFLEEWLSAQRFDLGLTEQDTPSAGTSLIPLLTVDEVCILPAGHRLLKKKKISLGDFADENFVSLAAGDPYRRQLDADCAGLGVRRNMLVEAPSAVAVCSLVRKGMGVAVVNPLTALDFQGRDLFIRPLSVSYPFRISIARPVHRPGNPMIDRFIQVLHDEARSLARALSNLGRKGDASQTGRRDEVADRMRPEARW